MHIATVVVLFILNVLYLSSFLLPFKTRCRESRKRVVLLAAQSRVLEACPREKRAFSPPPGTPDLARGRHPAGAAAVAAAGRLRQGRSQSFPGLGGAWKPLRDHRAEEHTTNGKVHGGAGQGRLQAPAHALETAWFTGSGCMWPTW